jgi:hypothetical protein
MHSMTNLQPHIPVPPHLHEPLATLAPVDAVLQEEIRILRERGFSDECIHSLFAGFNIEARPGSPGSRWNLPSNDQLVRLIWDRLQPEQQLAD